MNPPVALHSAPIMDNDIVNTNVRAHRSHLLHHPPRRQSGFSLLELLAVVAIIAIISGISIVSLTGVNESQQMNDAISKTEGALKRARAHAIGNQTYTWVGFFEKDLEDTAKPASAGKGELLIATVASTNGTSIYRKPASSSTPALDQNPQDLELVGPLITISHVDLTTIPAGNLVRDDVAPDEYQVGHNDFQTRPLFFGSTSKTQNKITFNYPLYATSDTLATFTRIIEFAPNGDATKIGNSSITRLMEIGLRPTKGNQDLPESGDVAVLQIKGITGSIDILRP